jgi:hypothetical protein
MISNSRSAEKTKAFIRQINYPDYLIKKHHIKTWVYEQKKAPDIHQELSIISKGKAYA